MAEALHAVDGFQVGVCTLLVVVEKRGAFERKHGEPRHQGVRHGHLATVTAVIRDLGETVSKQAEERICGKMFACFRCNEAHNHPSDEDIKAFNRLRQGRIVAWMFTKSQLGNWRGY